uniref:AMP-binding protein n=1 Tax=Geminicoccus flavidas TaxID=2506407 RepID=UPI001359B71D
MVGDGLAPRGANWTALSPLDFLDRSADVYPGKIAVVHDDRRLTYAKLRERTRRLAGLLQELGVG